MPDKRVQRGPHPADAELFSDKYLHSLQLATQHMSWLLTNGYAPVSSLKLVGDRFALKERQRIAVMRSACSDQALKERISRQLAPEQLADYRLLIDGFNLITTIEAAMSGGIILRCRDGCFRDMASMHGTYRTVLQTKPALEVIGKKLGELKTDCCTWLLDRPVSNSGRLGSFIRETAEAHGWIWEVELVADPDPILIDSKEVVVSADSVVLDGCVQWFNLARFVVESIDSHLVDIIELEQI